MKKRSFSLMEVMVSLLFFGLIVGYCFYRISFSAKATKQIELANQSEEKKIYLTQRIAELLGHIEGKIHTETPQKVVIDANFEVHPDPNFCGDVKASIYLEEKNLCLSVWNKGTDEKAGHKEILMRGSDNFSMTFYSIEHGICETSHVWEKDALPNFLIINIGEQIELPFIVEPQQTPLEVM